MLVIILLFMALFVFVFLPLWLLLDRAVKKYNFTNRFFNALLVLNAIFLSPVNIVAAFIVLAGLVWDLDLFNKSSECLIYGAAQSVSFVLALIVVAAVKFYILGCDILEYSKKCFFQLTFLIPLCFAYKACYGIVQFVVVNFFLYAVPATAAYMYLSGKYKYKPIWFKYII